MALNKQKVTDDGKKTDNGKKTTNTDNKTAISNINKSGTVSGKPSGVKDISAPIPKTNTDTSNLAGNNRQQAYGTPKTSGTSKVNVLGKASSAPKLNSLYSTNYSNPNYNQTAKSLFNTAQKANNTKQEVKPQRTSEKNPFKETYSGEDYNSLMNAYTEAVEDGHYQALSANIDYKDLWSDEDKKYYEDYTNYLGELGNKAKIAKGYAGSDQELKDTDKGIPIEELATFDEKGNGKWIDFSKDIKANEEETKKLEAQEKELDYILSNAEHSISADEYNNYKRQSESVKNRLDELRAIAQSLTDKQKRQSALIKRNNLDYLRENGTRDEYLQYIDYTGSYINTTLEDIGLNYGASQFRKLAGLTTFVENIQKSYGEAKAKEINETITKLYENKEVTEEEYNEVIKYAESIVEKNTNEVSTGAQLNDIANQLTEMQLNGESATKKLVVNVVGNILDNTTSQYGPALLFGKAGMMANTAVMSFAEYAPTYQQDIEQGFTHEQAVADALFQTGIEFASEMIGGERILRFAEGEILPRSFAELVLEGAKSGLAESAEEGIGWLASPLAHALTTGEMPSIESWNPEELKEAVTTAFLAGFFQAEMSADLSLFGTESPLSATERTLSNFLRISTDEGKKRVQDFVAELDVMEPTASIRENIILPDGRKMSERDYIGLVKDIAQREIKSYEDKIAVKGVEIIEPNRPNTIRSLAEDSRYALKDCMEVARQKQIQSLNESLNAGETIQTLNEKIVAEADKRMVAENSERMAQIQQQLDKDGIKVSATQWEQLNDEAKNNVTIVSKVSDIIGGFPIEFADLRTKDGKVVDGFFDDGRIVVNPNSNLGAISTFIHEYTHGTEAGRFYNLLREEVKALYDKGYKKEVQKLIDKYSDIKKLSFEDAEKELTARTVQTLLGNKEFISRLVKYHTDMAYKMYTDLRSMTTYSTIAENMAQTFLKAFKGEETEIERKYDDAVKNGDMKKAQELVKQYAVLRGYSPEQFYHATASEGFNEFDKSKIKALETDADYNGFWVSTDPDTSPSFRNANKVYPLYIKYGNIAPADVIKRVQKEVKKEWRNPDRKLHDEARSLQDEVRLRLEDMGYNSIVFDDKVNINVDELEKTGATEWENAKGTKYRLEYDEERSQEVGEDAYLLYYWSNGQGDWMWTQEDYFGTPKEIADEINTYRHGEKVVVLFEPNQLKSSAPVEYDDNGNAIPLNKRFDDSTNDLRYSYNDQEYMDAVNSGNMKEAQRLVDETAKETGFDVKVFHGTYNFGRTKFTDFGGALFLTDDPSVARNFSGDQPVRNIVGRFDANKDSIEDVVNYVKQNTWADNIREAKLSDFDQELERVKPNKSDIKKYGQEAYDRWAKNYEIAKSNKERFLKGEPFFYMRSNSFANDYPNNPIISEETVRKFADDNNFRNTKNGELNGGVYQMYLRPENMLEIEVGGNYYTDVPIPNELKKYANPEELKRGYATSDQILRMASDAGYGTIKYANMREGGDWGNAGVSNVYASLNAPRNVKSADPVVYDDNGNIIPLSERFNPNNDDIRYSYGYHYDNSPEMSLDYKSERLSQRGHDTGAFGTGQYYLGENSSARSYFGRGKYEHQIDTEGYNLFRPKDGREGARLHNALRELDRTYRNIDDNTLEEYLENIENVRNNMFEYLGEEDESDAPKLQIDDLDPDAPDFWDEFEKRERQLDREYDRYRANKIPSESDFVRRGDGTYERFLNEMIDAGMDEAEARDLYRKHSNDFSETVNLREVMRELTGDYINYESSKSSTPYSIKDRGRFSKLGETIDTLSEILNVDRNELIDIVYDAMVQSKDESKRPDFKTAMYDSVGTKVMKALGYEGIDVTGIEGLDDEGTGSVIYDLKPESVRYSYNPTDLKNDPKVQRYYATIAPYLDTRLNSTNREELISRAEKAYDGMAKEIADKLGIKPAPKRENIGGFENDANEKLRELSWTYDLGEIDSEKAKLFTSLMGDLAFENQEAVICMRYLEESEGEHEIGEQGEDGGTYGFEYGIKYKDLATVEKSLQKAGIYNYNIARDSNYLTVQDFGFDSKLPDKIITLLEEDNYESAEERPIYSYYLQREDRQSLYRQRLNSEEGVREGDESNLSGRIQEANERVTDVIDKKAGGQESPFLRRPEAQKTESLADDDLNMTEEELDKYQGIKTVSSQKYGKKNIDKETGILRPKAIVELDSTIGKTTHEEEIKDGEEYAGKFAQELDNGADVDDLLQKLMSNELQNGIVRAYYVSQVLADRDMQSEYMELAQWARDIGNLGGKLVESNKILYNLDSTFSRAVYLTQVEENLKDEYKQRLKGSKGASVEQTISDLFNKYANDIINSKTNREFRSAIGALTREVNRRMPKTIWDRITQFRMLAMLSGSKTIVSNAVSNIASVGLYRMNSVNQALLESALQDVTIKTVDDTKNFKINEEDRRATLKKDSKVSKRNRDIAKEVWKTLDKGNKTKYGIDPEKLPDVIKKNLKTENDKARSKASKFVDAMFETAQSAQAFVLSDAPFARMAFVQKFDELARARNINLETIDKKSKTYNRLIDDAFAYAEEVVSHNETDISKTIANITRASASNVRINEDSTLVGLDKAIKRFKERANNGEPIYQFIDKTVSKLQKWFIPFYKTNASIFQKSLQYSPLEWAQVANDWSKVKAGKMEMVDMVEHMAKAVTGTELYLLGAIFGFMGWLKWEKDDEDYSGRLSIKIPGTDKGYTTDFIDPVSTIFAKGVVLAQEGAENGVSFKTLENLVHDYEDIFLSDELDMFSSMKDFFDTVGKVRKGEDDYGEYTLGDGASDIAFSVLNSYIPAIVRDVSRMIDPAKKVVYDSDNKKYLLNRLINSTPFRTRLVDKKDSTGRTMNYTQPFTGNDVFDRLLTQMVSRGKLVDSEGKSVTTRAGSPTMDESSSNAFSQMAKDFQYKDENGDGFSDSHWIRDSVPSNIYPGGNATELTPEEKDEYGTTWTNVWNAGANYLVDNDTYKGLNYENQADVIYELQGFARECIEADYCKAHDIEMTEAQRTANEIRNFCTVNGKVDGKMLGLIALGTAKENKLASGGQRYVMAEQDENGKTIRNSRQLAMRHIYEEAGIYDQIIKAVQDSDGALTYADFGLGKTVVESYSDDKADSDYQKIYNKVMKNSKSSKSKSKKVTGGSAGGINKAKGGGTLAKIKGPSAMASPVRDKNIANNFFKAYANTFNRRGSSEVSSASGGQVVCPRCGNRVSSKSGRCPICGASL